MLLRILVVFLVACSALPVYSFFSAFFKSTRANRALSHLLDLQTQANVASFLNRERVVESMTIDEIKSELQAREIIFADCTRRSHLIQRLHLARANSLRDTNALVKSKPDDPASNPFVSFGNEILRNLSPDTFNAFKSDPELNALLQDPKVQDIIRSVNIEGSNGLKKYLVDSHAISMIQRLVAAFKRVGEVD